MLSPEAQNTLIHPCTGGPSKEIRQGKEIKAVRFGKKEVKCGLITKDVTFILKIVKNVRNNY